MTVNRRLVAVVVADVVGYSRLMERDEAGTHERLRKLKSELIDPKIVEHGGRTVKTTGDGMLVEFPSATSALRCAVEIQREMGVRNLYVAPDDKIQLRVGINLGDIIVEGDDIIGDGVNVAARLETLAEPGGICVASAIWEQVHEDLGVEFVDSGEQRVKNISKPIRVFRVALGKGGVGTEKPAQSGHEGPTDTARGATPIARRTPWLVAAAIAVVVIATAAVVWWRGASAPIVAADATGAPLRSVMIVPFAATPGDAELAAEAQRLTVDVTRALGDSVSDQHASVTPAGVAAAVAAKTSDPRAMAREANVRFVIDVDLRDSAGKVVATLRLFDAADARQVRTDRREFERARLADDHDAVVRQLTSAARVTISDAIGRAMARATKSPATAQDFLDRSFSINIADPVANAKETRRLAGEAIRLDPNFAPAWAQRAAAAIALYQDDFTADNRRLLADADADSLRAVTLDSRDALAWTVRSNALFVNGHVDAALVANDRALQLDPTRFYPLLVRAWLFVSAGRSADALKITESLKEPLASDSGPWIIECVTRTEDGAYDAAVRACERAAAGSDDWITLASLTAAHAQRGDMQKAAQAKAKLLAFSPAFTLSRYQAKRFFVDADAQERDRATMVAGLRKAGVPE